MHPRSSSRDLRDPAGDRSDAVTHAQVARWLVQRAAGHLRQIEDHGGRDSDSRLIRQALERLAVADLLIDAYAGPAAPAEASGHEDGWFETEQRGDVGGLVPGRPGNRAVGFVR